jgi:NDP-sugar pyrophosphorylase family protein
VLKGPQPPPKPVILAGGKGTRLAPLTLVLPKPLVPLVEGPIIDVLLQQLRQQGWTSATLAVGHMADLIKAYCGSGERYDLEIDYLHEDHPLGTVGPLAFLPEEARQAPVLVMNGDLLTTLRFGDLVEAHRASGAAASIAVYSRPIQMEFGLLDLGEAIGPTRRVTSYREKPEIEATVSMGVYVFEPEVLRLIPRGEYMDLPDLIRLLIEQGLTVGAYPFDGYWLDIGRHSDYQRAIDEYETIKEELTLPAELAR